MPSNLERLEQLVARLPEAERVDVEAWDGQPTFRVNGKTFVFCSPDAEAITVKLDRDEAGVLVATDPAVETARYGLGRAGWVRVDLTGGLKADRWREIEEWVRTSYALVAPRRLARQIADQTDPALERLWQSLSEARRRDARALLELMTRATGQQPMVHGSIVGFGSYHYRYVSGREGDAPAAAFAMRSGSIAVHLMDGVGAHAERLAELGPHQASVGCIHLKRLDDVDLRVLQSIVAASYRTLTAGTFTHRARESGSHGA